MKETLRFEKKPETTDPLSIRDAVVLKAVELHAFQKTVLMSPNKFDAIREVRALLPEFFPEVTPLSQEEPRSEFTIKLVTAAESQTGRRSKNTPETKKPENDFLIAKAIVDSLWQGKKK